MSSVPAHTSRRFSETLQQGHNSVIVFRGYQYLRPLKHDSHRLSSTQSKIRHFHKTMRPLRTASLCNRCSAHPSTQPHPAFMLHGRLQNKQEISHLRVAVVVKNRPSELKIVERRQRPPQQSVQNHRQLRARHRSVPAALTGTMAASSSMIRNMEKQHYEEILRRELDGLDNEFETLRLLSQELFVSANGLRFWKAA